MTALVTGATGLVGAALVGRLAGLGIPCRALVRTLEAARILLPPGIDLRSGDLTRADSLPPAVAGIETVYHCAGKVDIWGSRAEFFDVNVGGLRNLLAEAARAGVRRLVHVSSAAVHGRDLPAVVTEDHPFTDLPHPYIQSKIAAERLVADAHSAGRMETAILRPVHIHGPRSKLVHETARRIRAGKRTLISYPPGRLPLTGVENLVDALLAAGRPDVPSGRAWFITDDERVDWNGFVRAVAAAFDLRLNPRPVPLAAALLLGWSMELAWTVARRPDRPPVSRYAVLMLNVPAEYSLRAARKDLGYEPRRTLAQSLEEAHEAAIRDPVSIRG